MAPKRIPRSKSGALRHSTGRIRTAPFDVKFWTLSSFVFLALLTGSSIWLGVAWVRGLEWPRLVWGEEKKSVVPVCQEAKKPLKTLRVLATAYSSDVNQTDGSPCITSTGFDLCENYARYGAVNTVAANFLPPHSVIKMPELYGDKLFVVRDRMNDRFYDRIDVWMPTRSQAVRFGIKSLKVEVYGPD